MIHMPGWVSALAAGLGALAISASAAAAHPHVWVTSKSQLIFEKGVATAIRHAWTFDDMFSAQAVQGLDVNNDGTYTREELAPLAEINVTSMADFDFFTFAESGGGAIAFGKPVDYFLDMKDGLLTLHFTLPIASGSTAGKPLKVEIYDPSFFVDFGLAETEAAALVGAPSSCKADVFRPGAGPGKSMQLTESFFSNLSSAADYAAKLAPRIEVNCKS
jgi:ABC-type uncharacterized transport system substrate-binding protein